MSDWRTLQIFLGRDPEVFRTFEVQFLADSREAPEQRLRCTCPGWRLRRRCIHTGYILRAMEEHTAKGHRGGSQAQRLPSSARNDPDAFRTWVLEHAPVVVLDSDGKPVDTPTDVIH